MIIRKKKRGHLIRVELKLLNSWSWDSVNIVSTWCIIYTVGLLTGCPIDHIRRGQETEWEAANVYIYIFLIYHDSQRRVWYKMPMRLIDRCAQNDVNMVLRAAQVSGGKYELLACTIIFPKMVRKG